MNNLKLQLLLRTPLQLLRTGRRRIRGLRAKRALTDLMAHESPSIRAIATALSESLANRLSPEERQLVNTIEERRSSLLNSAIEIDVVDYGAGKPGANRTAEEMESGIVSTAQVSNICRASKSAFWATILFKLIRKLRPVSCVELGLLRRNFCILSGCCVNNEWKRTSANA